MGNQEVDLSTIIDELNLRLEGEPFCSILDKGDKSMIDFTDKLLKRNGEDSFSKILDNILSVLHTALHRSISAKRLPISDLIKIINIIGNAKLFDEKIPEDN